MLELIDKNRTRINVARDSVLTVGPTGVPWWSHSSIGVDLINLIKGSFGCNLQASDSVQNRVDLELQSDSEATVRLNSS